jgi:hypothetical protein
MEDQFLEKKTFAFCHRAVISTSLVSVAFLLTACGGGPVDGATLASVSSTLPAAKASQTIGAKPIDTFGNFNPSVWDDHNWYECNCARNPDTTPASSTPQFQQPS